MLVLDPAKRITIDQIKQDKWFIEGYENESSALVKGFELTPDQVKRVFEELKELGLEKDAVKASLASGTYDSIAATYYLVADKTYRKDSQPNSAGVSKTPPATDVKKETISAQTSPSPLKASKQVDPKIMAIDEEAVVVIKPKLHPIETSSTSTSNDPKHSSTSPVRTITSATSRRRANTTTSAAPVNVADLKAQIQSSNSKTESPSKAQTPSSNSKTESPPKPTTSAGKARPASMLETNANTQPVKTSTKAPASTEPLNETKRRGRAQTIDQFNALQIASKASDNETSGREVSTKSVNDKIKSIKTASKEPRTLRFSFSLGTTSTMAPELIMGEVTRVLKDAKVKFDVSGFTASCRLNDLEFEIEVCKIPRLSVSGLRFKRLAGDAFAYKDLLTELIASFKLDPAGEEVN